LSTGAVVGGVAQAARNIAHSTHTSLRQ